MIEMTLSYRHRIRNSSPGGLRPSTLPLGHGGSPQYYPKKRHTNSCQTGQLAQTDCLGHWMYLGHTKPPRRSYLRKKVAQFIPYGPYCKRKMHCPEWTASIFHFIRPSVRICGLIFPWILIRKKSSPIDAKEAKEARFISFRDINWRRATMSCSWLCRAIIWSRLCTLWSCCRMISSRQVHIPERIVRSRSCIIWSLVVRDVSWVILSLVVRGVPLVILCLVVCDVPLVILGLVVCGVVLVMFSLVVRVVPLVIFSMVVRDVPHVLYRLCTVLFESSCTMMNNCQVVHRTNITTPSCSR